MKLPTVALVGRPNVGKSTLFNKIVGKQVSIIEDMPGVTRDRIYQEAKYNKKKFYLVDTGGIDASKMDFNAEIKMQAEIAISEADIVVFIVDGKEGLTTNDLIVRDILRKTDKKMITSPICCIYVLCENQCIRKLYVTINLKINHPTNSLALVLGSPLLPN